MYSKIIISNLEKAVLIDEEIALTLEKIEIEKESSIIRSFKKLNKDILNEELEKLKARKEKVNDFFDALDSESLLEAYEDLAKMPKDALKMAKLEYLMGLINSAKEKEFEKEMVR